jgi:hypothetical protein
MWLEDDTTNYVMKAVRYCQQQQAKFDVELHVLDGNEGRYETYTLRGCRLDRMQHALWNYSAGCDDNIHLRVKKTRGQMITEGGMVNDSDIEINGTISSREASAKSIKLVVLAFESLEHEITELV